MYICMHVCMYVCMCVSYLGYLSYPDTPPPPPPPPLPLGVALRAEESVWEKIPTVFI